MFCHGDPAQKTEVDKSLSCRMAFTMSTTSHDPWKNERAPLSWDSDGFWYEMPLGLSLKECAEPMSVQKSIPDKEILDKNKI